MSIPYLRAAWEAKGNDGSQKPMTPAERLTLVALADYANDKGQCWPLLATLGIRICGTDRHVRTQLRKLEERGLLKSQRRGKRSMMFTLLMEPVHDRNNGSGQSRSKRNNGSGNKRNHCSGQGPLSGTIVPTEPTFNNPQENQTPLTPPGGERESKSSRADNFSRKYHDDPNTLKLEQERITV